MSHFADYRFEAMQMNCLVLKKFVQNREQNGTGGWNAVFVPKKNPARQSFSTKPDKNMALTLFRTDSENPDFQQLVQELDLDLAIRDGDDHAFYAQFNKISAIRHAIVAHENGLPVGCGAIKGFDANTVEVKRMFVPVRHRGTGVATAILNELQVWAGELGHRRAVLETGIMQPEAIALYRKNGFSVIPNYGQYAGLGTSVCFEKAVG